MKKFLLRISLFLLLTFFVLLSIIIITNKLIDNGNYFSLVKKSKNIALGHSLVGYAFNDSIINSFSNLGESGEAYFYTYLKVKMILKNNADVRTFFIGFNNNQTEKGMDGWISDDYHISFRAPKYSPFMSFSDFEFLLKRNMKATLAYQSLSLQNNFSFLAGDEKNYIKAIDVSGGYASTPPVKIKNKKPALNTELKAIPDTGISTGNIKYLLKIIQLCNSHNIQVILVRLPINRKYSEASEKQFKEILNTQFSNIEFLDFYNYPLFDDEFRDQNHLNHKGATEFSTFFNSLLNKNLLLQKKKGEFVEQEIAKRKEERFRIISPN